MRVAEPEHLLGAARGQAPALQLRLLFISGGLVSSEGTYFFIFSPVCYLLYTLDCEAVSGAAGGRL